LIEECSQPAIVDTDAIWRVKGSAILGRAGLAVLRELWQWREQEAIAYCRPPFFVLSHERMVDIAEAAAARQPFEGILRPRCPRAAAKPCWRPSRPGSRSRRRHPEVLRQTNSVGRARRSFAGFRELESAAIPRRMAWALMPRSSPARRPRPPGARLGQARRGADGVAAGVVAIILAAAGMTRLASIRISNPESLERLN